MIRSVNATFYYPGRRLLYKTALDFEGKQICTGLYNSQGWIPVSLIIGFNTICSKQGTMKKVDMLLGICFISVGIIWATPCETVSSDICEQRGPRSAYASAQSDQGIPCPLTESLDTIECINGEQRPGWDLAHAPDDVNPNILHMLKDTFSLGTDPYEVSTYLQQQQQKKKKKKKEKRKCSHRNNWNSVITHCLKTLVHDTSSEIIYNYGLLSHWRWRDIWRIPISIKTEAIAEVSMDIFQWISDHIHLLNSQQLFYHITNEQND